MNNNKGFSLVELIIGLAIMAILVGSIANNTRLLTYGNTIECAKEIQGTINKLRIETMSKGSQYYYLVIQWEPSDKYYYMIMVNGNEELTEDNWDTKAVTISQRKKIGSNKITISFTDKENATEVDMIYVGENTPLLISFYPSSGAFKSQWKQIVVVSDYKKSTIYMVTKTGHLSIM